MAEQEVIKHLEAAIGVARDKKKGWKHKLREITLEIGIIVFAVSLSIWLHNWAEGLKDREEERDFLVGLKKDLQSDLAEMDSDQASFRKLFNGVAYFQRVGTGEALNSDSLAGYQYILFSTTQIDPRVSRFEALRGSGRLGIIRDKQLLVNITDLYTKDFPLIRRVNDYINDIRKDKLMPWFAHNVQLNEKGTEMVNLEAVLRMPETRYLVATLRSASENIVDYGRGIDKIRLIINEIDKDLE
jgi:hypothetical protein